jgi:hypothetical protein
VLNSADDEIFIRRKKGFILYTYEESKEKSNAQICRRAIL